MDDTEITEFEGFHLEDAYCMSARLTSRDLSYYVGYALFPEKYKAVVDGLESDEGGQMGANITYFNSADLPLLLRSSVFKDKGLKAENLTYLGTDTAPFGGPASKIKIKEYLTDIVKLVKERVQRQQNHVE